MSKRQRAHNTSNPSQGYILFSPQVKSQQIIKERQQQYQDIIATSYFNKDRSPRSEFVKKSKPMKQNLKTKKIEISENITPFDSFKSTTLDLLNSVRFRGSFVDTIQLEQEINELDKDKTELIRLQKLKIQELQEKIAHQQKEIERLRVLLDIKELKDSGRGYSQEQQQSLTSVQDTHQRNELINLMNHIKTENKTIQKGREYIQTKEKSLTQNLRIINDTKNQIIFREMDSQRQQIKLNDQKKELQDWQVQLMEKEQEMSIREQILAKSEQQVKDALCSLSNHTNFLTNLQYGLDDQIQNLRGWDENVFQSLVKKYSAQSPKKTQRSGFNNLHESLLIHGI